MARNPRIRLASKTGKPVVKEVKALKRIKLMNEPPGPLPKGLHDKVLEDFRKETKRLKSADASNTPGEKKKTLGSGKTKAQKAAATSALNIEESKRKGTYTGKASKLKQKAKVKSRAGGAAFNPKLLGRSSPTDFTRGGRGPSGIPRKKL